MRLILVSIVWLWASIANAQTTLFLSGASVPPPPIAQITCDLTTGVATGATGPCVSPVAACNGVANDATAWASFATWAIANQGTKQIVLNIPSGSNCLFTTQGGFWLTRNIKNIIISGYGATFTGNVPGGASCCAFGGEGVGVDKAKVATVAAGANCVSLLTPTDRSLFSVGDYAEMSGVDIQGFGYPPNWAFFEYVQIASINASLDCSGAAGSSITFTNNLTHTYKSTWPEYQPAQGGPAELWALKSSWDTTVEIRGLTFNMIGNPMFGGGRSVTLRDVVAGGQGLTPSQAGSFIAINSSWPTTILEADKEIGLMSFDTVTMHQIAFQSSSVALFQMTNSTVDAIVGTPARAVITDTTIGSFSVGTLSNGRTDEVICTRCAITTFTSGGVGPAILNTQFGMSGGVITVPNGNTVITNAVSNGLGNCAGGTNCVRLTVATSDGYIAGSTYTIVNVQGTTEANGSHVFTPIDATHMDINVPFVHAWIVPGGGNLTPKITQQSYIGYYMPGTNLMWGGAWFSEGIFQVTDITQTATTTLIQTSLAGGYPSLALTGGGALQARVHSAPKFTCTNCTGNAAVVDLSQATPAAPIWSYTKRTYDQTQLNSSTAQPLVTLWGAVSFVNLTVNTAYVGVTNPLKTSTIFDTATISPTGTQTSYNPAINLRAAGVRNITPAGVTGTQTGDTTLALPGAPGTDWFSNNLAGAKSTVTVSDSPFSITVEALTNQGVVIPSP